MGIEIQLNGYSIVNGDQVKQAVGDFIMPVLTTERSGGSVVTAEILHSMLAAEDGSPLPNRGLISSIHLRAEMLRINVSVGGTLLSRPVHVHGPDQGGLRFLTLADFITRFECGMIRRERSLSPELIAEDVVRAFPENTIYFVGSRDRQNRKVVNHLRSVGLPCQHSNARDRLPSPVPPETRVVVSTFFGVDVQHVTHSDLVVLLDAFDVTHWNAQQMLTMVDAKFRLFGILDRSRHIAPRARCLMMAAFGHRVIGLAPPELVEREINVAWVDNRDGDSANDNSKLPVFMNHAYWRNHKRNRLVAKVAKRVAEGSQLSSRQFSQVNDWLESQDDGGKRVAVLVHSLEHAARLAGRLADWPIVVTGHVDNQMLAGMSDQLANRLRARSTVSSNADNVIAVEADALSNVEHEFDVIVNAGGSMAPPELPKSVRFAPSPTDLLVVDFRDKFSHRAKHYARKREQAYRQREIYPVGITGDVGRGIDFMEFQQQLSQQALEAVS